MKAGDQAQQLSSSVESQNLLFYLTGRTIGKQFYSLFASFMTRVIQAKASETDDRSFLTLQAVHQEQKRKEKEVVKVVIRRYSRFSQVCCNRLIFPSNDAIFNYRDTFVAQGKSFRNLKMTQYLFTFHFSVSQRHLVYSFTAKNLPISIYLN